ncbi:MAG: CheY-like chemotaxis protein [Candidatus Latescibacterota bacterium]|jgi:CheY-like chemotaxis protein
MTDSPAILAADTNDCNLRLLMQVLSKAGYRVESATNLADLDQTLTKHDTGFGLALIDVSGFDVNIWGYCDRLNKRAIPWLAFCLAHQEMEVQRRGYRYGTRGVLVKPITAEMLIRTIHEVLESRV